VSGYTWFTKLFTILVPWYL